MKHITEVRVRGLVIEVSTPSGWWLHFPKSMMHGNDPARILWISDSRARGAIHVDFSIMLPLPLRDAVLKYEWMFVSPFSWETIKIPVGISSQYLGRHKIEMPRL